MREGKGYGLILKNYKKFMFYLLKRVDEKQCNLDDRIMVLADFSGVPAGTKGKIVEIYDRGVTVEWELPTKGSWQKPLRDGFARDELEYLAFETEKHPKI
jgi:hypothetical protein